MDPDEDEADVGCVELGSPDRSVGSDVAKASDDAVRYMVSDGSEIRKVRLICARSRGEMMGATLGFVRSVEPRSGSLTVPTVLMWKRMVPNVRSNPSWKDPRTRR